jgi:prolyl oligopeptidase
MRPDLFGAIHCAVPLLDMKRFHTLLAGASWRGMKVNVMKICRRLKCFSFILFYFCTFEAEFGDPDTDDWDNFLYKYSPYHNIDESRETYPPMLVTTSTRDDRVHPAHARKMVKKLWDLGEGKSWPIHYYENIEGGHGKSFSS